MLHLLLVCPASLTTQVLDLLRDDPGVVNPVRNSGASLDPDGDQIEADVVREAAGRVLEGLTELGVARTGSIGLQTFDMVLSDAADAAERAVPGAGADAIVWDELIARTGEESELNTVYLSFLTIACLLAAVGVITDSAITIVGAMVVGPEFGPLAALAVGLFDRRWELAKRAGVALCVGFPFAMVVTAALAAVARIAGLFESAELTSLNQVDFIYHVGPFSVVVALLAGAAGMLALTSSKSSALVGVFISVTTVPAAGFATVAAVAGNWSECAGSLLQLVVNVVGITGAGVLVLLVRRRRSMAPRLHPRSGRGGQAFP